MNCNINFCITPVNRLMTNLLRNFPIVRGARLITIAALGYLLMTGFQAKAQDPMSRFRGMGSGGRAKGADSTLQHRVEDTININYRFLDSTRLRKFDSSVYDFRKKVPLQATYIDMGNVGTASRNLIFTPIMKSGFDPGWHAYDTYLFTTDETRFYNTTRPYSELNYLLGGSAEQMINLTH